MAGKSKIASMPKEIRDTVADLFKDGATVDQITEALHELGVRIGRSSVGRHVKGLAEIGEQMRRSRHIAEALAENLGDKPGNELAQLNMELMHNVLFNLMTAEEGGVVELDAKEAMFTASALRSIVGAQKTAADLEAQIRTRLAKQAAETAKKVASEAGLSAETVERIQAEILGLGK